MLNCQKRTSFDNLEEVVCEKDESVFFCVKLVSLLLLDGCDVDFPPLFIDFMMIEFEIDCMDKEIWLQFKK